MKTYEFIPTNGPIRIESGSETIVITVPTTLIENSHYDQLLSQSKKLADALDSVRQSDLCCGEAKDQAVKIIAEFNKFMEGKE